MEWIKLTKDNLPDKDVLAANFTPNTMGYKEKIIGYVSKDNNEYMAESGNDILFHVTHFIDLDQFDL